MNDNPETQLTPLDETQTPSKSRRWLWVILGALLIAVLASAAFLGGSYLQKAPLSTGGDNAIVLSNGGAGGVQSRTFSKNDIEPAKELPKTDADLRGIFTRRQDNSVFVGTGKVQIMISKDSNGSTSGGSSYDGPEVEVVTTANTQVYYDDTFQNLKSLPSNTKVQQKVVPGSLDEIGQNSMISAWGKKVGDRLVADVLVYTQPQILNAPLK